MTDYARRKCRQSNDLPPRGGMSGANKQCNRCRRVLPLKDFRLRTTQEGARYAQSCCKSCETARTTTRRRLRKALSATVTPVHTHDDASRPAQRAERAQALSGVYRSKCKGATG